MNFYIFQCFVFLMPLLLLADGDIYGRVVAVEDSAPIEGVTVTLSNIAGETIAVSQTAFDGTYRFDSIRSNTYEGHYLLEATALEGYLPVSINPLKIVVRDRNVHVGFSFGIPTSFSGTVRDEQGIPLPGALIRVMRGSQLVIFTYSDASGFFSFEKLAPRPFFVQTSIDGFEKEESFIILSSQQENKLDFQLKKKAQEIVEDVSFPEPLTVISPPREGKGRIKKSRSGKVHVLEWVNSGEASVEFYAIYQEGNQIATVPATKNTYTNKKVKKNKKSYQVFAVDSAGNKSESLNINVK